MTTPIERCRSIQQAKQFLKDLLDPKNTPRVPRDIRHKAYYALKHFPTNYELEKLRQAAPELLGSIKVEEDYK